jgi:hypothetical protein
MLELSFEEAVSLVREIVEKYGEDYVYPQGDLGKCDYVREGQPSCLVGHVLVRKGVPIERLQKADKLMGGAGVTAEMLLPELQMEEVLKTTDRAAIFLDTVQSGQDEGVAWGDALDEGLRQVNDLFPQHQN